MAVSIVILILGIVALLVAMRFAHKLYPLDPLAEGKKVHIYQDGRYNRTATITGLTSGKLVIYDVLPLPIHYRGKFYSVGYTSDGFSLMFIGRKRLFFLAKLAELIRKIANTPEHQGDLPSESQEETTEPMEGVEDEV